MTWGRVVRRDSGEAQLSIVGKGSKSREVLIPEVVCGPRRCAGVCACTPICTPARNALTEPSISSSRRRPSAPASTQPHRCMLRLPPADLLAGLLALALPPAAQLGVASFRIRQMRRRPGASSCGQGHRWQSGRRRIKGWKPVTRLPTCSSASTALRICGIRSLRNCPKQCTDMPHWEHFWLAKLTETAATPRTWRCATAIPTVRSDTEATTAH